MKSTSTLHHLGEALELASHASVDPHELRHVLLLVAAASAMRRRRLMDSASSSGSARSCFVMLLIMVSYRAMDFSAAAVCLSVIWLKPADHERQ